MAMPAGDGMHAPSGYEAPTAARMRLDSVRRRLLRTSTSFTMLASMSSVNESNFWPAALRYSIAASDRL